MAKFDRRGSPLWSREFDLGNSSTAHLAADGAGNVILGGGFTGTVDLGTGPITPSNSNSSNRHPYIVQLDGAGNTTWARTLTASAFMGEVYSVAASDDGDVAVGGWFSGTDDLGCGPLGGPTRNENYFVASLDTTGGCRWNVKMPVTHSSEMVSDVAIDKQGSVFVTGSFFGTTLYGSATGGALFVAGFSRAGALSWSNLISAENADRSALKLAVDAYGNVSIAVESTDSIDFGDGPHTDPTERLKTTIAQYDAAGSLRWSSQVGNRLGLVSNSTISASRPGALILGGTYVGTISVAGSTLIGDTIATNIYVAKLAH